MMTTLTPGFQGFLCELTGEPVPAALCLACAETGAPGCKLGTPAIIAGIIRNMRAADFSLTAAQAERADLVLDHGFSVTELLGCPRKKRLVQTHPWWEKPGNLYWAFRGNLMHAQAEQYAGANPYALAEARLFWYLRLQGRTIGLSGAPDLVVYEPHQCGWKLVDYKTITRISDRLYRHLCPETGKVIADMPYPLNGQQMNCRWCETRHPREALEIIQIDFQPRGTHQEQLQLYSLLIEKNQAALVAALRARLTAAGLPDELPAEIPVTGTELVYMDMKTSVRTEVEIWSQPDRLAFLKLKLAAAIDPALPPVLTDPGETWQCRYCPVAALCADLNRQETAAQDLAGAKMPAAKAARLLKELGF